MVHGRPVLGLLHRGGNVRAGGSGKLARGPRGASTGDGAGNVRAQPDGGAGADGARPAHGARDGHGGAPGRHDGHADATDAATHDDAAADADAATTATHDDAATHAVRDACCPTQQWRAGRGPCRTFWLLQLACCPCLELLFPLLVTNSSFPIDRYNVTVL